MEIPQSIKDLPREKLEKIYIETISMQHDIIHRANDMEECIKEIEKYVNNLHIDVLGHISETNHLFASEKNFKENIIEIIDKYRKWFDEC